MGFQGFWGSWESWESRDLRIWISGSEGLGIQDLSIWSSGSEGSEGSQDLGFQDKRPINRSRVPFHVPKVHSVFTHLLGP